MALKKRKSRAKRFKNHKSLTRDEMKMYLLKLKPCCYCASTKLKRIKGEGDTRTFLCLTCKLTSKQTFTLNEQVAS